MNLLNRLQLSKQCEVYVNPVAFCVAHLSMCSDQVVTAGNIQTKLITKLN